MAIQQGQLTEGAKVRYVDPAGVHPDQLGIVKDFQDGKQIAFVVYNCNEEWDKYRDYTGVSTFYANLELGWEDQVNVFGLDVVKTLPMNGMADVTIGYGFNAIYMGHMHDFSGLVEDEIEKAKEKFPLHFINYHEAFAVILEEVDELKAEVWKKGHDADAILKEVTQIAAMCSRLAVELVLLKKEENG